MKIIKHKNTWPWGKTTVIIADNGNGIVRISIDNKEPEMAFIVGLSVIESARQKGLGTKLIQLAEEEIKQDKNIKQIRLTADVKSFVYDWYHRLGYQKAKDTFYLDSPQLVELVKYIQ